MMERIDMEEMWGVCGGECWSRYLEVDVEERTGFALRQAVCRHAD